MFYKWRPTDIPEWNSVFAVIFCFMANYFAIAFFFGVTVNKSIAHFMADTILPVVIILGVLNYLLYIKNNRYLSILDELSKRSDTENKQGITIVVLLAVEAFSIPWILMLF